MAKHTRSTENPTKSNVPELVIERVFDAPREAVFDAWVDGAKVKRWSSPEGFSIPESSGDARPGGKW